jgi:hypothetical protein
VLWLSFEGRDADLMTKMWLSCLRVTRGELRELGMTDPIPPKVEYVSKLLSTKLTHLHIPKSGLTVEEVIGIIRMRQQQRIGLTGKGYDLLVVDYPAILTTSAGKAWEFRQSVGYIYRQFVQLALEERFHALLAVQTNREGAKLNRNAHEESGRLLVPEHISESFDIAMCATNILTVNRDDYAAAADRLTFLLCKSRSAETGWAVTCRSRMGWSLTHAEDLGATAYRGNGTLSDKIEDLLKNYRNRDVPLGYVTAMAGN